MRGKTNIPPRKNPVINGDLQNFVVANGNTITRGDFVSFQVQNMIEQTSLFSGQLVPKMLSKKFTNNYYVYEFADLTNNYCNYYLIKCESGVVTVIDSILGIVTSSAINICQFDVYNNKLYILTADKKIRIYSITISGFTFVKEISITYSGYSTYMYNPCMVDDTHLVLINYYSGQQPGYWYGILFDVDEENSSITHNHNVFFESGSGTYGVKRIDSKTCVFAASLHAGSSNRKYRVVKFSNDFSSETIIENTLPSKLFNSFEFSENGICFCGYCGSDKTINVMRYDDINARVDSMSISLSSYFAHTSTNSVLGFIYNNKIFVIQAYSTSSTPVKYGFDAACIGVTSNSLEVLSNATIEVSSSYGILAMFYDISNNIVNIPTLVSSNSNKYFMWQEVEYDEVILGKITSFVEEYSASSRKPIGFANTSGVAGDIVQVFVPPTPQSNS